MELDTRTNKGVQQPEKIDNTTAKSSTLQLK